MRTADVSLITYTFNDGSFVDGLLAGLADWTLAPKEVVVVDDGSDTPYAPPPCPVPVRLLRHAANLGIPSTKHEAISAGTAPALLAMDCDTRVVPDWLERCLPQLARPEVGLVSGPVDYRSGDDLVSRFQRAFGDNHNIGQAGATGFVPGNAFLLRRATWEACGGMAAFAGDVCEDHFLCEKIKGMGLLLWVEEAARAWQIRRINRLAMLRRYWKWCHGPVKRRALSAIDIPNYVFAVLAMPMAERVETAIAMEEPLFIYLELVYLSFAVLDLLDFCIGQGKADAGLKTAWWGELKRYFKRHPALWAVLRGDLVRLGQPEIPGWPVGAAGAKNPWEPTFIALDALGGTSLYDWLSHAGIPAMMAEEKALDYDFSFYAGVAL